MSDFEDFGKIARLSRECVITEKIDGTNAQIFIWKDDGDTDFHGMAPRERYYIKAGSRSRWITPDDDNFGFAKWVDAHAEELITGLGEGRHFGEWWGSGVQRGYGLTKGEKRFSLFNTHRWSDDNVRPQCCGVVPILFKGEFDTTTANGVLESLRINGSIVSPSFMDPEGIIIYHTAAKVMFKKTIEKDDEWKGKSANTNA